MQVIYNYHLYRDQICEFYEQDPQLPIYERIPSSRKWLYSIEDIVRILLNSRKTSSRLLCSKVPTSISSNVAFVVDTSKLEDAEDVMADDMGVWKNNRVDTGYVRVSTADGVITQVEKCGPPTSQSAQTYTVKRIYHNHGTNPSLRKLTARLYGKCTWLASCMGWGGMVLQ